MPRLFELLRSERRLFIPKSREMMLSWAVVGYAVWVAQWHENSQIILQSERESKSVDLVVGRGIPGYARVLWEQQDAFLKRLHPLTKPIDDMPGDLSEAAASYDTAEPVATQIIVVSSAGPSWVGDVCQSILERSQPLVVGERCVDSA
jgi:hypothetical protein